MMTSTETNRRAGATWCSTCRDRRGPFVYMESGRHYCKPCAYQVRAVMGVLSVGRRHDDATVPAPLR